MVAPDRDKLRRAFGLQPKAAAPAGPSASPTGRDDLRAFLQRRSERFTVPPRPQVALPEGEVVETAHGCFWRRQLRYPLCHRHGAVLLGSALACDRQRLAALAKAPALADFDIGSCLFLDTETTGLSGGAGTVVFNLGLGWFEDDAFVLEQTFLRSFGEELAMLHHVAVRLQQRPLQVTYVGKSFDRHRIAARMTVHKLDDAAVLHEQHLDLYHVTRRAFGRELPDCKLRTVEGHKLGFWRQDDLPGSEAPLAFLDWVRDGTGPVDRVLEHNRLDVLSVAALLAVLAPPPTCRAS